MNKQVLITIANFPAAGQTSRITTKPLEEKAAATVIVTATALGHTAVVCG